MNLSEFITGNMEEILAEWEKYAVSLPPSIGMDRRALRNEAKGILEAIAHDMGQTRSPAEQEAMSKGSPTEPFDTGTSATSHANVRLMEGYDINQLVSEFRALRASVIRLWTKEMVQADLDTLYQSTRFNEAMDLAIAESIAMYSHQLNRARNIFMGILGHDLRTPLGAIAMSAQYLLNLENLPGHGATAASRIVKCANRMKEMISDLLDVTRTRLGGTLPIEKKSMDLHEVCNQVIEEAQAFHPERIIILNTSGNLEGNWDSMRLLQLLSNLINNAITHGSEQTPVTVSAVGEDKLVFVSIHNEGHEIPEIALKRIFEPLVREGNGRTESEGLGLGLYIAQNIAKAHAGSITVSSSKELGTVFKVCLPRAVQ
jgi:signal transduction histidine kinase